MYYAKSTKPNKCKRNLAELSSGDFGKLVVFTLLSCTNTGHLRSQGAPESSPSCSCQFLWSQHVLNQKLTWHSCHRCILIPDSEVTALVSCSLVKKQIENRNQNE